MVDVATLRRILLALPNALEAPHFDRRSFKAGRGSCRRTILTLAPDEASVNFMFTPEEQTWKLAVAPDLFAPVPGGWGRMGATTAALADLTEDDLAAAVTMIFERIARPPAARRRKG